jgi:hypothetical protein
MQIEAASPLRSCCGQRFQARSRGSENSDANSRTSNPCGSSDRCAIASGMLFALRFSWSTGAGRSERPVAVIASLVARQCSHPARHRLHSVVRSAQSMPKAKPVEHRPVLGRCLNRPSCDRFPTSHSKPSCRVRHANGKSQVCALAGRDHCCSVDHLVSLAVERNTSGSTAAHFPDTK